MNTHIEQAIGLLVAARGRLESEVAQVITTARYDLAVIIQGLVHVEQAVSECAALTQQAVGDGGPRAELAQLSTARAELLNFVMAAKDRLGDIEAGNANAIHGFNSTIAHVQAAGL